MARTGRPRSFDAEQAVGAAVDLFWRQGYAATSLRDLQDGLGVLPGSLYAAFGDKHGLFLRALDRYASGARQQGADLVAEGPYLPRIRELLMMALAAAHEVPGQGCMLGNTAAELLPADAAAGELVRGGYEALERGFAGALAAGQRTGEVAAEIDCATQARMLLVLLQGLHVVARAEADPSRLAAAVDAALAPLSAS